jgi:HAD superfamily hydrolase (TIGR01509 family)
MIHGVIFDLGSTLLYTDLNDQWESVFPRMDADLLASLQAQGYALDGEEFVRRFVANFMAGDERRLKDWKEITAAEVLTATLAELGAPPLAPAVMDEAMRAHFSYPETLWRPMPGVYETLERLAARGHKLAIISNASDDANVQRLIDNAHLRRYFDPIIVSAAMGIRKPASQIFQMVLELWDLPAGECVMVGDTLDADILGAQMAGLHNVWLTARADRPANRARRAEITPEVEIAALDELPGALRLMGDET